MRIEEEPTLNYRLCTELYSMAMDIVRQLPYFAWAPKNSKSKYGIIFFSSQKWEKLDHTKYCPK